MRPTRRWGALAGVGVVLLAVAVVGDRPFALVGAAVIGGGCLATAVQAMWAFTATQESLSVSVSATPTRVAVGHDTTCVVDVSADQPLGHAVTVSAAFPSGVDGERLNIPLETGATETRQLVSPTFPVAGRFDCPTVTVEYESPGGYFTEVVPVETDLAITVEAQGTGDVHVGAGGSPVRGSFGSHTSDRSGARGDDLASIRQYEPGDSVRRVDWKITARLDEPHVREYEMEFEQSTRLVVDARTRLGDGPTGWTKLDFIREVALGVLQSAEAGDDPLGLTIVDDGGVRTAMEAASTDEQYQRIRERLYRLGPDQSRVERALNDAETGPADAARAHEALTRRADSSMFTTALRPFFHRTGSYVDALGDDPLFAAVKRHISTSPRGGWTVLLTDDAERGTLFETAKLATRGDGRATVFLTPSALFEDHDVSDLEGTYEELVAFEEFRRRLDRLPRVAAFEVTPDDRLRTLLAQGTGQRRGKRRTRGRKNSAQRTNR